MRIVNPYVKYSYDRMLFEMQQLAIFDQAEIISIGKSRFGREILVFRLGNGEKKLLIVGTHHGREYISAAFIMRSLEDLIFDRAKPFVTREMLSEFSLYFIPMLNPDGAEIAIRGEDCSDFEKIAHMKRVEEPLYTWKANGAGVDLNRHYPCLFEEKYSDIHEPASEGFKGEMPGTEPEVMALMSLCEKEDFASSLTFHAKGEEIYWADSNSREVDMAAYPFAKRLAEESGYRLMPPSNVKSVYGAGFENWFRAHFHKPSVLIELSPYICGSKPHDMQFFDMLVWQYAKNMIPAYIELEMP